MIHRLTTIKNFHKPQELLDAMSAFVEHQTQAIDKNRYDAVKDSAAADSFMAQTDKNRYYAVKES